mmetsp:Transcript_7849/g.13667  ORF Transcript_7849/g.13667 Transcript_7849/m.13667 type:complete len:251 (-) Transcript_7849:31-783(-)
MIFILFLINVSVQLIMWAVSSYLQTEKYYDLTGTITYMILTFISLLDSQFRMFNVLLSSMEFIWAARLGYFLALRVHDRGDRRFQKVKTNPKIFLIYWLVQAVWIFITNLPIALVNLYASTFNSEMNFVKIVSISIFIVAFAIEVIADQQKSEFRKNNKGFINIGIWRFSRHPNYLGEIFIHFAIALYATQVLKGWLTLLPLITPVFIAFLLIKVSGIPILERMSDKKYGDQKEYQEYKKNTAILIPFIW